MTARHLLPLPSLAAALALGCAGGAAGPHAASGAAGRAAAPAARTGADAAAPAAPGALTARQERLFAEAVQAEADQRKLKVPTDWPLLERRWRAVVEEGDVAEAWFNLGVTLEAQGRLAEARTAYQRARALKPSLRQAALNLAVLEEKVGDARAAQAAYAAVVREFPEDGRARERLAALYLDAGQLDEAWRLSREALLRDARAVGAYRVMARVALARDQADVARLLVLRAQKIDAADPELSYLLGEALAKGGDAAAAVVQWKKALAQDEHHLPSRYALFRAALSGERWGAVIEEGEALLRDAPGDAGVLLAVGVAHRHLEHADQALAAFAKAEQAAGGRMPEVNLARGVLQMRVQNACEPALEEFRKYRQAAGPMASTDSQVLKLERECEGILEENRKALAAAQQLRADAAKKDAKGEAPAPKPEEDPLAVPPAPAPAAAAPGAPGAPGAQPGGSGAKP